MLHFAPFALILIAVLQVGYGQNDYSVPHSQCHHVKTFQNKKNFQSSVWTKDYDMVYQVMRWQVDPAEHYITGQVSSDFVAQKDNFTKVHFDLAQELTINEISQKGILLNHRWVEEDVLEVDLTSPIQSGEAANVVIQYEGEPPANGFGSFVVDTHNDVPVLWTLSEPYGSKDWWPCKQDLIDKIDSIDIYVTVPHGNKVASNGLLLDSARTAEDVTFHWSHRYPIPAYLVAIGVTNYFEYSDYVDLGGGDSLQILNYVYPEDKVQAMADTKFTVEMMKLYNELFGLYPFSKEKYGHAQFGVGGGIEHQTMSFMGGFSFELQAHELAHQWFGDKVTCGSWQDIWLNEGFATYLTGLTIENISDPIYWRGWRENNLRVITSESGGSVYVTDTTDIGRIFSGRLSYAKGGYVLHMLRWVMGDESFFEGCRNYLNDPDLSYGYAKTSDLMHHLEAVHRQSLETFFENWIYNEGFPSYTVFWEQTADELVIQVGQTTSHPSVDFFQMPIPVHIYSNGVARIEILNHIEDGQVFRLSATEPVDSIKFDEELWLISSDNKVERKIGTYSHGFPSDLIKIDPNPFRDYLEIQETTKQKVKLQIFDLNGTLKLSTVFSGDIKISTDSWSSGTYLVQVEYEGKQALTKVLKW